MFILIRSFLIWNLIGERLIHYYAQQLLMHIYTCSNKKIAITSCFCIKIYIFLRMKNTPFFSFCNKWEETPLHIFIECTYVVYLWKQLASFFENNFILQALKPQISLLEHWSDNINHVEAIINHFLLIFKLHVYDSRKNII